MNDDPAPRKVVGYYQWAVTAMTYKWPCYEKPPEFQIMCMKICFGVTWHDGEI